MYCNKPDRDVASIECGYPLPCPYHTNIVDASYQPPAIDLKTDDAAEIAAIIWLAAAFED